MLFHAQRPGDAEPTGPCPISFRGKHEILRKGQQGPDRDLNIEYTGQARLPPIIKSVKHTENQQRDRIERSDSNESSEVEGAKISLLVSVVDQDAANQKAGQHEEQLHPGPPDGRKIADGPHESFGRGDAGALIEEMKGDDEQDCDAADGIESRVSGNGPIRAQSRCYSQEPPLNRSD